MPYHSSKSFYKAELEERDSFDRKDYEEIRNDYFYCHLYHYACKYGCETNWTSSVGLPTPRPPRCACCLKQNCKFVGCTCDYCYELNWWNNKTIVEKYFTAEQILAYNSSLPLTDITRFYCEACKKVDSDVYGVYNNGLRNVCMNRIYMGREDYYYEYEYCMKKMIPCGEELIVKKKELYKHIQSDKYGLQPFKPQTLHMNMISDKTLDYFINIHRQNVFEYHQQTYDREAGELLKKYGLTLADYKKRKCGIESV